jgi:hypothetical protein
MPLENLHYADASSTPRKTITLGDLRELVVLSTLLPDDCIVRANAIPFHLPDLGNWKGGRVMTIAIDVPDKP